MCQALRESAKFSHLKNTVKWQFPMKITTSLAQIMMIKRGS